MEDRVPVEFAKVVVWAVQGEGRRAWQAGGDRRPRHLACGGVGGIRTACGGVVQDHAAKVEWLCGRHMPDRALFLVQG